MRAGLLYDVHFPYHNVENYNIALDHLKNLKPKLDTLILAGDFVDFYKISFWKSDPDRLEFREEVTLAREELKRLKKMFPRVQIDYIEGNHEERLYRYVRDKAPDLLFRNSIRDVLDLRRRRINYISNIRQMSRGNTPYSLGKLYVLHGHEKKMSMNAVNLARLLYNKCRTNVIAGHHHKADYTLIKKLDGTYEGAWCVGTLGQLSESYQPINEWVAGFAYVDVEPDGWFQVHNKIILEGRITNSG